MISALTIVLSAILLEVTRPVPIVVANVPVPEPVTSPVKVIVWSPVFVPDELPEKFKADKLPVADRLVKAPDDGVLAPIVVPLIVPPLAVRVPTLIEFDVFDRVKAVEVVAPRAVTEANVSASVPVIVKVPPE